MADDLRVHILDLKHTYMCPSVGICWRWDRLQVVPSPPNRLNRRAQRLTRPPRQPPTCVLPAQASYTPPLFLRLYNIPCSSDRRYCCLLNNFHPPPTPHASEPCRQKLPTIRWNSPATTTRSASSQSTPNSMKLLPKNLSSASHGRQRT